MTDSINLNAKKRQSRLICISFGAWDELNQYLDQNEQLALQALNKFSYKTAVSRVQTKINFNRNYFIFGDGMSRRSLIIALRT